MPVLGEEKLVDAAAGVEGPGVSAADVEVEVLEVLVVDCCVVDFDFRDLVDMLTNWRDLTHSTYFAKSETITGNNKSY